MGNREQNCRRNMPYTPPVTFEGTLTVYVTISVSLFGFELEAKRTLLTDGLT